MDISIIISIEITSCDIDNENNSTDGWILNTGFWNDGGMWIDIDNWID